MSISRTTRKKLWGLAASRCAFPTCRQELIISRTTTYDPVVIGEEAHIVASSETGPRGASALSAKERDSYENLILLCSTHHTLVDKQREEYYPVSRLQQMKAEHERWVRETLQGISPIWYVPYPRNPLFTGRKDVLDELHDRLILAKKAPVTHPQALTGLGGIGKTQIALEYAYIYRAAYQAVFWVNASSPELLASDFFTLARLLQLAEQDEQDQQRLIAAVKYWFAHHAHWLLILDNADNLALAYDFLPPNVNGHILLTGRSHATGASSHGIELENMNEEDGTLFLLRRCKLLGPSASLDQASTQERMNAQDITKELDCLPLALDQAGAYIEETACDIATYQTLYIRHRWELLGRRGAFPLGHPASVVTTWSISFQKIAKDHPLAADLLRFCAFLAPDAIPEELLAEAVPKLDTSFRSSASDPWLFNQAIEALLALSLLRRNRDDKTFTIHRLVQAVLKDEMDETQQRCWASLAVQAMSLIDPSFDTSNEARFQLYLSHSLSCAKLIEQFNFTFEEATTLLNQAASCFDHYMLYAQAEHFLQRVLAIYRMVEHVGLPAALNNLAEIYRKQAKYIFAEPLYKEALVATTKAYGPESFNVAICLYNLGLFYFDQGRDGSAEQSFLQALLLVEKTREPNIPFVAKCLSSLASIYQRQDKDEIAEALLHQAFAIRQSVSEAKDADVALSLYHFALFYQHQEKYEQAISFCQSAIALYEQILTPNHPLLAKAICTLAKIYSAQKQYDRAEPLFHSALEMHQSVFGRDHPDTANSFHLLGQFYFDQKKYEQAEHFYLQALSIREQVLEPELDDIAKILHYLALLYDAQGKQEQAEAFYKRAIATFEKALHSGHSLTVNARSYFAELLYQIRRPFEDVAAIDNQTFWLLFNEQRAARPNAPLSTLLELTLKDMKWPSRLIQEAVSEILSRLGADEHARKATTLRFSQKKRGRKKRRKRINR